MLKINRKVEYALMALKFILDKKDPEIKVSAREICEALQTPFDTTAKVMQVMNNQEILTSSKGIKGGYTLKRPLKEVSFLELVKIIEGVEFTSICTSNKGPCDLLASCNIADPLRKLNRSVFKHLDHLSLEELLNDKRMDL